MKRHMMPRQKFILKLLYLYDILSYKIAFTMCLVLKIIFSVRMFHSILKILSLVECFSKWERSCPLKYFEFSRKQKCDMKRFASDILKTFVLGTV